MRLHHWITGIRLQKRLDGSLWERVKQSLPKAEAVANFTVFNIKGNSYRLIVSIDYEAQIIYVKYVLTHAEYDKDEWKYDPFY